MAGSSLFWPGLLGLTPNFLTIAKLFYYIINNLLYFDNNKCGLRLYISTLLKVEVFKLIYNNIEYSSYIRIYK